MSRYLITPTLLNSWSYFLNSEDEWTEGARTSFRQTLSREKFEPTEDMAKGNKFEADVFAYVDGYRPTLRTNALCDDIYGADDRPIPGPEMDYWDCVADIAALVGGGVRQLAVKREISVDGMDFLLYGRVDHLAGPWCTDIKWTGNYEFPKFKDTAQHPIYLACLPDVPSFRYLVSDGKRTYEEVYQRRECRPAEDVVSEFCASLKAWPDAWNEYLAKWVSW